MKTLILSAIFAATIQPAFSRTNNQIPLGLDLSLYGAKGLRVEVLRGFNADIDTSSETIWDEGGAYAFPAAAAAMTVSSSSASDDAGSTGALTVEIKCLTATYAEATEIVTMDGQTEVTMATECLRIQGNGMKVLTAGSAGSNVGIVYVGTGTVTTGKPANVFGLIRATAGRSSTGVYTVPLGKSAQIVGAAVSARGDNTVSVDVLEMTIRTRPFGAAWFSGTILDTLIGSSAIATPYSEVIPARTDIDLRGIGVSDVVSKAEVYLVLKE